MDGGNDPGCTAREYSLGALSRFLFAPLFLELRELRRAVLWVVWGVYYRREVVLDIKCDGRDVNTWVVCVWKFLEMRVLSDGSLRK